MNIQSTIGTGQQNDMKKEPKTHRNTLYAIHYKGQLLGSFQLEGGNASSYLQGWRPPKKVYWKLGLAKSGATHLPEDILDDCEIVEYAPVKTVTKLSTKDRQKQRLQKELESAQRSIKYNEDWLSKAEHQYRDTYEQNILHIQNKIKELTEKLSNI